MANIGYAKTRAGIAKTLTIILGIICVGLTAYAFDRQWKEEVFLGVVITCLVISILTYVIYILVTDSELNTSSKAADSGFHFIAALVLLVGGSLMIYSAVDLWNHWKYFCSYGFDRGIPCLTNKYDNNYYPYNGKSSYNTKATNLFSSSSQNGYGYGYGNYGETGSYNNNNYNYNNGGGYGDSIGRSFFNPSWLTWLKGANVYEECRNLLPRVLRCNEYYELKLASGIIGILNGIFYGVTGIVILTSN